VERERSARTSLEQTVLESQRRSQELQELLQERERELGQTRRAAQVVQDQGALLAEAESLRTVLELRSQENAQLRSEVDLLRRELDEKELLKQKYDGLEARCEDLKAQLQSKEAFERQLTHDNEVSLSEFIVLDLTTLINVRLVISRRTHLR
jgi:regulator of replication initiation timing